MTTSFHSLNPAPALRGLQGVKGDPGDDTSTTARRYLDDIQGVRLGYLTGINAATVLNTALINAALALGGVWYIRSGAIISISQTLSLPSNTYLIAESGKRPIIFMPAAYFNSTALSGGKYNSNAVGIGVVGLLGSPYTPASNVTIDGIGIESEVSAGRVLRGILGRNASNLKILNCEIYNFPVAIGICLSTITGESSISGNSIHDFYDNTTTWGSLPQSTGIEVDNDIVNGVSSSGITISSNRITSILFGAAAVTAWGYQTDGINLVNPATRNITLTGNVIDSVGEGMDIFASNCLVLNNSLSNCFIFALKLIHGASYNVIDGLLITNAWVAGVLFYGTTTGITSYNRVSNVIVRGVDPTNTQGSLTACIKVDGLAAYLSGNTVTGATLDEGTYGKYGWLDISGATTNNLGEALNFVAGANNVKRVSFQNSGTGSVSLAGALQTRVTSLV